MNTVPAATTTPANDNNLRPAEFDRQLALAYPRLVRWASRYTIDPHTIVQDAMVSACTNWASFRQTPGNPYFGFFTWLQWKVRANVSAYKRRLSSRIVTVSVEILRAEPVRITLPAQEAATDLARVMAVLTPRERNVLLRRVAGEQLVAIGADIGVSKQRASQIESGARAKVLALVAANDNGCPC